jgi:3-isopropylmalate/(R)-2-methylmalate dehydratase small subunit
LECIEAVDGTEAGDILEVDLATGKISNVTRGKTFVAEPYPDFMMGIINAGGLIGYTKKKLSGGL